MIYHLLMIYHLASNSQDTRSLTGNAGFRGHSGNVQINLASTRVEKKGSSPMRSPAVTVVINKMREQHRMAMTDVLKGNRKRRAANSLLRLFQMV